MQIRILQQEVGLAPEAAEEIFSLIKHLNQHSVFGQVKDLESLRVFMEVHVFAVWDFMSLLKRLQADLTCIKVPWLPADDPVAARLINEIVLQEESDICDDELAFLSHFELYRHAMLEVGADGRPITEFLQKVQKRGEFKVPESLQMLDEIQREFVVHTLDTAMRRSTVQVLASFVLGREEIVPGMFRGLLEANPALRDMAPTLSYYLERHITVDGELHGPAAWKLVKRMISQDSLKLAEFAQASIDALTARIQLWDRLSDCLSALSIAKNKSA